MQWNDKSLVRKARGTLELFNWPHSGVFVLSSSLTDTDSTGRSISFMAEIPHHVRRPGWVLLMWVKTTYSFPHFHSWNRTKMPKTWASCVMLLMQYCSFFSAPAAVACSNASYLLSNCVLTWSWMLQKSIHEQIWFNYFIYTDEWNE